MYDIKVNDFYCQICGKTFDKKRSLSLHIYYSHNMNAKSYYDIYYKQPNEDKCLYCGKQTQFLSLTHGYRLYCCRKCADSDIKKQNKTRQTFLNNYNVDSVFKIKEIHDKGVIASQSEEAREKRNNTNIQKYGSYNVFGSNEIVKKISNTKTKNGNRSKLELFFEEELTKKHIKFESEHKDELYPYNCDFYLPELNIYIEINSWWYHNNHFYNETDDNDIQTLNLWKDKSKINPQYNRAIEIWTKRDIEKRNTAIKNNLNYVVLWNKQDIINFLQTL